MTWLFMGLFIAAALISAFAVWASPRKDWYNADNRWLPCLVSLMFLISFYGVMGEDHSGECLRTLCTDIDSTTDYLGQYIMGAVLSMMFGFLLYAVCSTGKNYQSAINSQRQPHNH